MSTNKDSILIGSLGLFTIGIFIIYIACYLINLYFFNSNSAILLFIDLMAYPASAVSIIYVQTLYVIHRNTFPQLTTSVSKYVQDHSNSPVNTSKFQDWTELVAFESGFELFISYLVKSFQSENMLCILEVIQWKQQLFAFIKLQIDTINSKLTKQNTNGIISNISITHLRLKNEMSETSLTTTTKVEAINKPQQIQTKLLSMQQLLLIALADRNHFKLF